MSEWDELAETLTWHFILAEYLDAMKRVELYAFYHRGDTVVPGDVALSISGLTALWPAVRGAAEDLTTHQQVCPRSIADAVLRSVRRARRVLPAPEMPMSTAGHA